MIAGENAGPGLRFAKPIIINHTQLIRYAVRGHAMARSLLLFFNMRHDSVYPATCDILMLEVENDANAW